MFIELVNAFVVQSYLDIKTMFVYLIALAVALLVWSLLSVVKSVSRK